MQLLQPPRFLKYSGAILTSSFHTLAAFPVIWLPFIVAAFIELFVLEILYFIPQYPADVVFAPVIRALWGEPYLHYPSNFYLLPQLFQDFQIPMAVFVSSFLAALAVSAVVKINNEEPVDFKKIAKGLLGQYVHIALAALISFALVFVLLKGYGLIFSRGLQIRSTGGLFYLLKTIVVKGQTAFSFLLSVLATTLTVYILPVIVVERKKVHAAVWANLKLVCSHFWLTLTVVLTCSLIFIPVFLIKGAILKGSLAPGWTVWMIVLDILAMMVINTLTYTAATALYLSKKEKNL